MSVIVKTIPTPRSMWLPRIFIPPKLFQYTRADYLGLISKGVSYEDELLIILRAKDGLVWSQIPKVFKEKTGVTLRERGLRSRYRRLPQKYHVLKRRTVSKDRTKSFLIH